MSNVLVTGGAGFIGTHLCHVLKEAGHFVHVLDLVDPKSPVKGVHYHKGDVRDLKSIKQALKGMDVVYHLAAIVSVPLCQQMPIDGYQTNLLGTVNVAQSAVEEMQNSGKQVRMIFSSSAAVYGDLGKKDTSLLESVLLPHPLSFYAAQKLGSEHLLRFYWETKKLPVVTFRFFNVFGPGQDPHSPYSGVITVFASALEKKSPLFLNGGGFQTRDFVSVYDIAKACCLALDLPVSQCDGLPINLGTEKAVTIEQLAKTMKEVSKQDIPIKEAPPRSGDVLHSLAGIQRANEVLKWAPQITLSQGLKDLYTVSDLRPANPPVYS